MKRRASRMAQPARRGQFVPRVPEHFDTAALDRLQADASEGPVREALHAVLIAGE